MKVMNVTNVIKGYRPHALPTPQKKLNVFIIDIRDIRDIHDIRESTRIINKA